MVPSLAEKLGMGIHLPALNRAMPVELLVLLTQNPIAYRSGRRVR